MLGTWSRQFFVQTLSAFCLFTVIFGPRAVCLRRGSCRRWRRLVAALRVLAVLSELAPVRPWPAPGRGAAGRPTPNPRAPLFEKKRAGGKCRVIALPRACAAACVSCCLRCERAQSAAVAAAKRTDPKFFLFWTVGVVAGKRENEPKMWPMAQGWICSEQSGRGPGPRDTVGGGRVSRQVLCLFSHSTDCSLDLAHAAAGAGADPPFLSFSPLLPFPVARRPSLHCRIHRK